MQRVVGPDAPAVQRATGPGMPVVRPPAESGHARPAPADHVSASAPLAGYAEQLPVIDFGGAVADDSQAIAQADVLQRSVDHSQGVARQVALVGSAPPIVHRAVDKFSPAFQYGTGAGRRSEAPVVQRVLAAPPAQAQPAAAMPVAVAPPAEQVVERTPAPEPVQRTVEVPVVQRAEAPPPEAPQPVAQPQGQQNAEELLRKLYDPLLRRLKADLWLDRERRGALTDL
ncbi:hypothetical protein ABZ345_24215 [Lentzea sp. NPDC005914]|uniref:hypothetical protein n=1 Tax=Lentzea sp. NPDC005914 TaxID=3154572 RepID=UPI0034036741